MPDASSAPEPDARRALVPPPAVLWLIGLTCLPELVLILADHGIIGSARWRPLAYHNGAFWAGLLRDWRPNYGAQPELMFVTHAVLHAGFGHLAGNMLALWSLGGIVVQRIGQGGMLALYLASTLGGGVGFYLLTHSPAPMVGASGALFGLAGAWQFWEWQDRRSDGRPVWPVLATLVGLVALNALFWLAADGLLAWETHLGGFVTGWLVAWGIGTQSRPVENAPNPPPLKEE